VGDHAVNARQMFHTSEVSLTQCDRAVGAPNSKVLVLLFRPRRLTDVEKSPITLKIPGS